MATVLYKADRPSRKRFKPETFDPGASNNAGFFETRAFKQHEGWAWGKDIKKKNRQSIDEKEKKVTTKKITAATKSIKQMKKKKVVKKKNVAVKKKKNVVVVENDEHDDFMTRMLASAAAVSEGTESEKMTMIQMKGIVNRRAGGGGKSRLV